MLNITYSPADADLAERMQDDLSRSGLNIQQPMLIVLVSPDSNTDESVQQAIYSALDDDLTIVPVKVADAPLPEPLQDHRALDLSAGYDSSRLIGFIKRARIRGETRASNNRLLFYLLATVILVFVISLGAIGTGIVRAPQDEFATEEAIKQLTINAITAPTIEGLMPRTTEDAQTFPQTLEAMDNDDTALLLRLTATARAATPTPTPEQPTPEQTEQPGQPDEE